MEAAAEEEAPWLASFGRGMPRECLQPRGVQPPWVMGGGGEDRPAPPWAGGRLGALQRLFLVGSGQLGVPWTLDGPGRGWAGQPSTAGSWRGHWLYTAGLSRPGKPLGGQGDGPAWARRCNRAAAAAAGQQGGAGRPAGRAGARPCAATLPRPLAHNSPPHLLARRRGCDACGQAGVRQQPGVEDQLAGRLVGLSVGAAGRQRSAAGQRVAWHGRIASRSGGAAAAGSSPWAPHPAALDAQLGWNVESPFALPCLPASRPKQLLTPSSSRPSTTSPPHLTTHTPAPSTSPAPLPNQPSPS